MLHIHTDVILEQLCFFSLVTNLPLHHPCSKLSVLPSWCSETNLKCATDFLKLFLKLNWVWKCCVCLPPPSVSQFSIGRWMHLHKTLLPKSLFSLLPAADAKTRKEATRGLSAAAQWYAEHAQLMAAQGTTECLYHVKDGLEILRLYLAAVHGHPMLLWSSKISSK